MRLLLTHGGDVAAPGGLETHVQELAAYLTRAGHEVEVYARPQPGAGLVIDPHPDPARYDLVHHHSDRWPRGLGWGRRAVRTIHFCTAAKMAAYVRRGRLRTLVHPGNWRAVAAERAACHRPWRLIAVSHRVREECARFYGLASARAVVIPNGVSFAPPEEPRDTLRRRHGLDPDQPVLLTIGRPDYVKGHDLLARAWQRVKAAHPRAVWVSVGGHDPRRSDQRLATGPVSHAEALAWTHAADIGAFPSISEGCGLALLEMLAARLYTLTHDVGIAPEVIHPGENGEIVAPTVEAWTGALGRVLERAPARPATGLPPRFDWDAIGAEIERVYRLALEGPQP